MNRPNDLAELRAAEAVYLTYAEGLTQSEIADRLGVSQSAVSQMLHKEPGSSVQDEITTQAAHTHQLTWMELTRQYRTVIERATTAMELTEDWGDGEIQTADIRDDDGQVVERIPIPDGFSLGPDHEARADAEKEIREILDQMKTLTGGSDTFSFEFESQDSTDVEITTSVYSEDDTEEP